MPYRRRSTFRRRRRFKRRSGMRNGTAGLTRRSLMRTGGFSAGSMELKFVDIQTNNNVIGYNLTTPLQCCNSIAAGTDYGQRLSRRICMKSIMISYLCQTNSANTAPDKADYIRVWIVYDLQSNGVQPAITDFLATTLVEYDACVENNNLNNRARFLVLYDKKHVISTGCAPVYVRKYVKLRGLETTFNATTNGYASISTGSLWVFAVSGVYAQAGAAPPALATLHTRVRFVDCS
nr:MAG: capsid protein [Cressdnaviricota sp.]